MTTVDWAALWDAYGPATRVPELLAQMSPDPDAEVWGDLWGHICHQGTVYSASFAALPFIVDEASSYEPLQRLMPLILCSDIVASRDGASSGEASSHIWRPLLPRLLQLTNDTMTGAEWKSGDAFYLLAAWLVFQEQNAPVHQLQGLADEELQATCPGCKRDLFVAIGSGGHFTTIDDYATKPQVRRSAIHLARPDELRGLPRSIFDRARTFADDEVDSALLALFGNSTCVACGTALDLWVITSA